MLLNYHRDIALTKHKIIHLYEHAIDFMSIACNLPKVNSDEE